MEMLGQPSYSPRIAPLLLPPSIVFCFCFVLFVLFFEQNRSKGMFLIPQDPGREMPRCCFRQVIPSLPLLCSHVLHKRTFIPHFHSTHIAWRNIKFHSAEECNMMSPSLRFKSVGLERFFVMPFILSHGTRMMLGQYKTRTDESFPI